MYSKSDLMVCFIHLASCVITSYNSYKWFRCFQNFFPNLLPQARLAGSFWKGDATAPRVEGVTGVAGVDFLVVLQGHWMFVGISNHPV